MPDGTIALSTTVTSGTTPIEARIYWNSTDNAAANNSTFQATLQARRTTRNFGASSSFNINFLGRNDGYTGAVDIPGTNVWTTIYSTPVVTVTHDPNNGQAGFTLTVTGGRIGQETSWLTTSGSGPVTLTTYTIAPPPPPPTPAWSTAPGAITPATRNLAYSFSLSASPVTSYGLISSSGQTAGLSLASNGVISGTPTTTGTATFNVRAFNGSSTADRTFTIAVNLPAPGFSDSAVNPAATVGISYSDLVTANDSLSYSLDSGSLPNGLSLISLFGSGFVTGTPTVPGTFTFTIRATNSGGTVVTGPLTITVIASARVWNGSSFVRGVSRVWNGSSFTIGIMKVWNGSAWVDAK